MSRLAALGRRLFAASLIGFGVEQLVFGEFVVGRAPAWPASWPGGLAWADLTGAFFIVAGAAILFGWKARRFAVAAATLVFFWALVRQIPVALADTRLGAEWTRLGKAVALIGGAVAVAGPAPRVAATVVDAQDNAVRAGRICLGAFLVLAGIQHFLWVPFVAALVPAWIPGPTAWTYIAGVLLIAGGVGMSFPPTARLAAALSGLMIFSWVLVLHVPRALAAPVPQRPNEWIAVFEALAFSGVAFTLAGAGRRPG